MLSILQKGTEKRVGGDGSREVYKKGVENSSEMGRRMFVPPTFERLRGKLGRQAEVLMSDLRRLSLEKTHMGLGDVHTQWYQRIKALLPHFLNNPTRRRPEQDGKGDLGDWRANVQQE